MWAWLCRQRLLVESVLLVVAAVDCAVVAVTDQLLLTASLRVAAYIGFGAVALRRREGVTLREGVGPQWSMVKSQSIIVKDIGV